MGSKGTLSSGEKSQGRVSAYCSTEQLWDVRVLGLSQPAFLPLGLRSLSFSDCCPQLSLALRLTKRLGRNQAPSFCTQSRGPGQGSEREFTGP